MFEVPTEGGVCWWSHFFFNVFFNLRVPLEPLLSAHFPPIQPINIPRYQKYPMGDGQSLSILELIQSNPSLFQDPRTPTTPGRARCPSNETRVSQPSNEARISYPSNEARVRCPSNEGRARCPSNEARVRRGSNDSIVSGLFDTQQMQGRKPKRFVELCSSCFFWILYFYWKLFYIDISL